MWNKLKNNRFLQYLLPLFLGNSAGQVILVLSTPIITRIYSPESYGLLTLYYAILSVLSIAANARYEQAIMLPEDTDDAKSLLFLSVSISLGLSVFVGLAILIMGSFLYQDDDLKFLYFLVPGVFLTGLFQALTVWNNRLSKFRTIANANVIQTGTTAASQVLFGVFHIQIFGLLVGAILGLLAGTLIYTKEKLFSFFTLVKVISFSKVVLNAKKYREFPTYSMFGALAINIALQSPVFIVGIFFEPALTGQYGLAARIVLIPLVLLSTAVFQVIYKEISILAIDNFSEIRPYVINKLILLALIGLPALIVLNVWSETLFVIVFGPEWGVAGKFAKYLSWAAFFKFSITPLMAVFNLRGLVKVGSYWQILYVCTLTLTLTLLWQYQSDTTAEIFVQIFVLHEIVLSLICFGFILYVTSANKNESV